MRSKTILALLLLALPLFAAKKNYGTLYVKNIVRVYDGDTFYADIDRLHPLMGNNISIRINGIDTPERRGGNCKEFALLVRDYLEGRMFICKTIELRNVTRGKYFRIIADVYIDGVNIAEELIEKGYAKPYDGGKKPEWNCD